jgi:hypothetical protein
VATGFPKRSCTTKVHDPEKLALGLDPTGGWFSEKIMHHQRPKHYCDAFDDVKRACD